MWKKSERKEKKSKPTKRFNALKKENWSRQNSAYCRLISDAFGKATHAQTDTHNKKTVMKVENLSHQLNVIYEEISRRSILDEFT